MKYKKCLKDAYQVAGIAMMLLLMALYLSWAIAGDTATKIEFIKVIPVTIIGLIAAGIAYAQYRAAKAKLNIDLFEKRYEIFQLTWEELTNGANDIDEIGVEFTNSIPKSQFLFGLEIHSYLNEIVQRRSKTKIIKKMFAKTKNLSALDSTYLHETNLWLAREAISGAKERFGKYMNFEEWK